MSRPYVDLKRVGSLKRFNSMSKAESSVISSLNETKHDIPDSDSEYSDSSNDDQITENNKFYEFINMLRYYVTLENIKAFFQWITEYAKIEVNIAVSGDRKIFQRYKYIINCF